MASTYTLLHKGHTSQERSCPSPQKINCT